MVVSFAFCVQGFLEHGGPVWGWRVWNRGPGLFKGFVFSSLEVLGAGTKKKGV